MDKAALPRLHIRADACLLFGLTLSVLLLSGCFRTAAQTSQKMQQSPTTAMSQLLEEPWRWLNYNRKERFAMYNNALSFYRFYSPHNANGKTEANYNGAMAHTEAANSGQAGSARVPASNPQLQRLDDIFLSYLNTHPADPYNSYYLYNIAGHYIERGERALGLWLLRSLYQNFPDLQLPQYPSIHYLILDTLGRMENSVDYRIEAIRQILSNYSYTLPADSSIGMTAANRRGVWLYRLGNAYESKAAEQLYINPELSRQQLSAAMDIYSEFSRLDSMDSILIPEEHNARSLVTSKLNIYNARRNWYSDPDLENLITRIKTAVHTKDVGAVLYYQANGFFVLSADYRDDVARSGTNIYLPHFLGGTIQFGGLTPESNDEEAWLYSTNWPFNITTWYLYFQKIHYPTDPEIDGNWEWSGIYLGDFY